MAQTPHNNNLNDKDNRTWCDPYAAQLLVSDVHAKWTEDEIKQLMTMLIEYCSLTDEGLSIGDFLIKRGIPQSTYTQWCKKPWVKKINEQAKTILFTRRRSLAEARKFDKDLFIRHQHLFDPDYHKDVNEYWRRMKTDEQLQEAFQLIINAAKDTGRVMSKEEKKKEYEAKRGIQNHIGSI